MLRQNDVIKVTMISNAMSHHQLDFCDSMANNPEVDFHFVATKPISKERLNMGYSDLNKSRDYIICRYDEAEADNVKKVLDDSEFVIIGSAPVALIRQMLSTDKWIFIYSERLFKKGIKEIFNFKKIIANMSMYFFASHKKLRLLCASAYSSKDYKKFRFKRNEMLKWGYYPPVSADGFETLFEKKAENSIVWVGRMIDWKHPETAILLADKLKKNNIAFNMTVIGNGYMESSLKQSVKAKNLENNVTFTGALAADQVRKYINNSGIFITTSDYNEGWGAVVNEAMNGACAVVASSAMGSVPFLIEDGFNGFSYKYDDIDELYLMVKKLLEDKQLRKKLSKNAYNTIINEWNGKNASDKLVRLFKEYKNGNTHYSYDDGICSIAEVI